MTTEDRETEPGFVLHAYQRAKAKARGLIGRGKSEAAALLSGSAKDDPVEAGDDWKGKPAEEVTEADEVRSQEEMKETFDGDGVMPSDERRKGQKDGSQKDGGQKDGSARMQGARTDLPDGSATAVMQGGDAGEAKGGDDGETRRADEADLSGDPDDGGMRGETELDASDVRASIGADDNPAAPAMADLDQTALARLAEDEAGRLPDHGLGLDDGPRVTYPSDIGN